MTITITRSQLDQRSGKYAWVWLYYYSIDGAESIPYDTNLSSLRDFLSRKYGKEAKITEEWKEAEASGHVGG